MKNTLKHQYAKMRNPEPETVEGNRKPVNLLENIKLSKNQIKMLRHHKLKNWNFKKLQITYEV